ncbi:hypothetical protein ACOMHN_067265 [Nucella lapillus]
MCNTPPTIPVCQKCSTPPTIPVSQGAPDLNSCSDDKARSLAVSHPPSNGSVYPQLVKRGGKIHDMTHLTPRSLM